MLVVGTAVVPDRRLKRLIKCGQGFEEVGNKKLEVVCFVVLYISVSGLCSSCIYIYFLVGSL